MAKPFLLYWLTETGGDLGTPATLDDIDEIIRPRVAALHGNPAPHRGSPPVELHLPFLDRREMRRRGEILRGVKLAREGDVIYSVPRNHAAALRDRAALLIATHPAWRLAPDEFQPDYFKTWQRVSLHLQDKFREWIPEIYFRDPSRYEDRPAAYPLLVYAASRPCYGRPKMEFTYDVADPQALQQAWKMIGLSLQRTLAEAERRVAASGRVELARRYAPVWHEDILRAVRAKPEPLLKLLGQEAALVNAIIGMGTTQGLAAVKPFARTANAVLRRVHGDDMRELAPKALEEATLILERRMEPAAHCGPLPRPA
jgi:hypothetical protein